MLVWEKAEAWNIPVMRTPRNYGKGHQTETLLDDGLSASDCACGLDRESLVTQTSRDRVIIDLEKRSLMTLEMSLLMICSFIAFFFII
jgi:hypothetical protein